MPKPDKRLCPAAAKASGPFMAVADKMRFSASLEQQPRPTQYLARALGTCDEDSTSRKSSVSALPQVNHSAKASHSHAPCSWVAYRVGGYRSILEGVGKAVT